VNAISPENAELALVITAEVDETAVSLTGAGERHLVNRSNAVPVFILEQHNGLARQRGGQTKIRKFDNLAEDRWLRSGDWGMGLGVHLTIEAEAMYPLK
jgi:hypothetical protein